MEELELELEADFRNILWESNTDMNMNMMNINMIYFNFNDN